MNLLGCVQVQEALELTAKAARPRGRNVLGLEQPGAAAAIILLIIMVITNC